MRSMHTNGQTAVPQRQDSDLEPLVGASHAASSSNASDYVPVRNEREIIKTGLLSKRAVKGKLGFNWRKRIITVHPARVTWCKQNSTKVLGEFVFGLDTQVRISRFRSHCFCLASFEKELHVQCASEDEVKEWIECIRTKTDFCNIRLNQAGIMQRGSLSGDNDTRDEMSPLNSENSATMLATAEQKQWIHVNTIKITQLTIGTKIGAGASGQVYKGCFKVSGAKVAIKQLFELMIEPDEKSVKAFLREASTLASLHHPHIVHQFGVAIDRERVFIVMELCEKSLHKVITEGSSKSLDLTEKLRMLTHIVEGMIFLHSRNIVHRDLKPENILVGFDNILRIADFGLARVWTDNSSGEMTGGLGTPSFMAPEMLRSGVACTEKVDIYSFAVVSWALMLKRLPFEDTNMTHYEVMDFVMRGDRLALNEDVPLYDVIEKAWSHHPDKRPSFEEIGEMLQSCKV